MFDGWVCVCRRFLAIAEATDGAVAVHCKGEKHRNILLCVVCVCGCVVCECVVVSVCTMELSCTKSDES